MDGFLRERKAANQLRAVDSFTLSLKMNWKELLKVILFTQFGNVFPNNWIVLLAIDFLRSDGEKE